MFVCVGIYNKGTSDVMKALVGNDSSVALATTFVSVAAVLGLFTTLIIAISLFILLQRHRRYLTCYSEFDLSLLFSKFISSGASTQYNKCSVIKVRCIWYTLRPGLYKLFSTCFQMRFFRSRLSKVDGGWDFT